MNPLKLPLQQDVETHQIDGETAHLVTVTDENRPGLVEVALFPYIGQPCYFCHVPLTRADLDNAVRANDPPGKVELAHEECWEANGHKGA